MGSRVNGTLQADQFIGGVSDVSPFGKIWYVDGTNGADGNSGDAPDQAFATIAAAIAAGAATRGDMIVVAPGTYTITAALVPKAQMTFIAAVRNRQAPTVTITGNIANLMTVNVSGTRFAGLAFKAGGTSNVDLIKLSNTAAVNGVIFEDCLIDGNGQTTGSSPINGVAGISSTGSLATTGLVIRRCVFKGLGKTPLEIGVKGMPVGLIEQNVFSVDTPNGMGIFLDDTAAFATGKGAVIRDNDFIMASATTTGNVGIVIAGTVNATGADMIRNNYFAFAADAAITGAKLTQAVVNNYRGGGTGGTIIAD